MQPYSHAPPTQPTIVRATIVLKSGTLYALSDSGVASAIDASPAARADSLLILLPISAFSASIARRGTGAAAPSTIEAFLQFIWPSNSSATATSASGQSKDSFSP